MQRAANSSPQRGQGAVRPQPGEVWAFHGWNSASGEVEPVEIVVETSEGSMVTGTVRGTSRRVHASHATTWRRVL